MSMSCSALHEQEGVQRRVTTNTRVWSGVAELYNVVQCVAQGGGGGTERKYSTVRVCSSGEGRETERERESAGL